VPILDGVECLDNDGGEFECCPYCNRELSEDVNRGVLH
jgi:hypothetical protein